MLDHISFSPIDSELVYQDKVFKGFACISNIVILFGRLVLLNNHKIGVEVVSEQVQEIKILCKRFTADLDIVIKADF